jgi:hypothetical protein
LRIKYHPDIMSSIINKQTIGCVEQRILKIYNANQNRYCQKFYEKISKKRDKTELLTVFSTRSDELLRPMF